MVTLLDLATRALEILDELNDRSIGDLVQCRKEGTFSGDIYDAPDDCDTLITVTRGELRTLKQFAEAVQQALGSAPPLTSDVLEGIEHKLRQLTIEGNEHLRSYREFGGEGHLNGVDPDCPNCDMIFGEAALLQDAKNALEDVARSRLVQQADLERLERECVDSYLAQWFLQGGQAEFGEIEKAFATDADGFMGEVLRLVRALSRPARDRIEQADADRAAAQQEIARLRKSIAEFESRLDTGSFAEARHCEQETCDTIADELHRILVEAPPTDPIQP